MSDHSVKVEKLQNAIKKMSEQKTSPIALHYGKGHSNTTRTKEYKKHCSSIDFGQLNEIIHIDCDKRIAIVEPRVTMKMLLQACLPHHLAPPVLPEFKGITVGGAILGGAAESGSHKWGCFNDICLSYEILSGKGDVLKITPYEKEELYYGIAGSYGSLGALVSTEVQLISVPEHVYLTYHFSKPLDAIEKLKNLYHSSQSPPFLDGIIFSKEIAVIIEGHTQKNEEHSEIPIFCNSPLSPWFYQHLKQLASQSQNHSYQEKMKVADYFFRYDLGAFWMGTFLFQPLFLSRFITEGLLGFNQKRENFTENDIQRLHQIKDPNILARTLFHSFMGSQNLWSLLHRAEKWIQNRIIIQDCCIPESNAKNFCEEIMNSPAIFPIWLCPIKGMRTPQIFSPHLMTQNQNDKFFINLGLYGIPSQAHSIKEITKTLEKRVGFYGGRKVLYSHSYYTKNEFWQIYPHKNYENLRKMTDAKGVWRDITDKVLSI